MTEVDVPITSLPLDSFIADTRSRLAAEINACGSEISVDRDEDDDDSLVVVDSLERPDPLALPDKDNCNGDGKEQTHEIVRPTTSGPSETTLAVEGINDANCEVISTAEPAHLSKAQLLRKLLAHSTNGNLVDNTVDCSSSVSKLDVLRARTKILRRAGSMRIAETRKSLGDSSRSVRSSPMLSPAGSGWDELTVETVSSRTWNESPPLYGDQSQHATIPLQVLLQGPNKSNSSVNDDFEQRQNMKHIMQENEILKLKVELLEKKNSMDFERDLVSFREILQEKTKTRKAHRMGVTLFIAFVVFASLLGWDHPSVQLGDSRLLVGLIGTIRKELALNFKYFHEDQLARLEEDEASIQNDDITNGNNVEPKRGPFNRLFFNMKNDQAAVWLKRKNNGKQ